MWFERLLYGNHEPSIFADLILEPRPSAIMITGALPFRFNSFDYSSNNDSSSYLIQALLEGSVVFEQGDFLQGSFPDDFGFNSVAAQQFDQGLVVDTIFALIIPGTDATSVNIDNIHLTEVLEPGPLLLLSAGLSTVFLKLTKPAWLRSRRNLA
jgi:hypothetical protein